MSNFSVNVLEKESETVIKFNGEIGYESQLPNIEMKSKPVKIDMTDVKSINSPGINTWRRWMNENTDLSEISLIGTPEFFIRHMQNIKGLNPPNVKISSFFVPYFSEETGEQKSILFSEGTEFKYKEFLKIPVIKDSTGLPMEIDVNQKKFFEFIKASIPGG